MRQSKYSKLRMEAVDESIHELSKQSQIVQKSVWGAFLEEILMSMSIKAKKIDNSDHNHDILNSLNAKLDKNVRSGDGKDFMKWYVDRLDHIGELNKGYFEESEGSRKVGKTGSPKLEVGKIVIGNHDELLKLLGYDMKTGRISNKSYLYNLLDFNGVYTQLQKKIIDAIFTGQTFDLGGAKEYVLGNQQSEISNQTGFEIVGLKSERQGVGKTETVQAKAGNQSGGAVEGAIAAKTMDGFQQYDRTLQKSVAADIGYGFAIYQGGLIKTSREFCIERNDKVFSKDEIAKFGSSDDKYDGYTDKGDFNGKRNPYNPFADLGGWNCRHHLDWISDELAAVMRNGQ